MMHSNQHVRQKRSRGYALVIVLLVIVLTSRILIGIGSSLTSQSTAYRNSANYDQAQYLAGAGVHHAVAMLEQNSDWRGTISNQQLPIGSANSYSVTAVTDSNGDVAISSEGTAGDITRSIFTVASFDD